jgi:alkylation response protein AidB-like acyl-CoA dehydrogenase
MTSSAIGGVEQSSTGGALEAARGLAELVDAEADEAERTGTMTPAVVDALRQTGLFWAMVPVELGGGGVDVLTAMAIIEEITRVDGSTGWSLMANMTSTGTAAAYAGDRAVDAMFGTGRERAICAGMLAPRGSAVPDATGYVVTGRYGFGSGIAHSNWTGSGCLVRRDGKVVTDPDGQVVLVACIVPSEQVQLEGNWDVHGMCATGSYDYAIEGVHVDEDFTFPLPEMPRRRGGPLYELGLLSLAAAGHAGVATGLAIGAMQELARYAELRKRQGMAPLTDQQLFLHGVAETEAALQAARAYVRQAFADAEASAVAGSRPTDEQTQRLRQATTYVTGVAVQVVRFAYAWGGSAVIRTPGALARALRDVETASQHIYVDPNTYVGAAPAILAAWAEELAPVGPRTR